MSRWRIGIISSRATSYSSSSNRALYNHHHHSSSNRRRRDDASLAQQDDAKSDGAIIFPFSFLFLFALTGERGTGELEIPFYGAKDNFRNFSSFFLSLGARRKTEMKRVTMGRKDKGIRVTLVFLGKKVVSSDVGMCDEMNPI